MVLVCRRDGWAEHAVTRDSVAESTASCLTQTSSFRWYVLTFTSMTVSLFIQCARNFARHSPSAARSLSGEPTRTRTSSSGHPTRAGTTANTSSRSERALMTVARENTGANHIRHGNRAMARQHRRRLSFSTPPTTLRDSELWPPELSRRCSRRRTHQR